MINKYQLNHYALELRSRYGEDDCSYVDVFGIINRSLDTTMVFHPMPDRISGMCMRINKQDQLIAINSSHSYGRQRFTAAHELYHLNFQENFRNIICSKDLLGEKDEEERNADDFASYFLAPMNSFKVYTDHLLKSNGKLGVEEIIRLEQYFQISRGATLVRLKKENFISGQQYDEFKSGIVRTAKELGFDDHLYRPTSEEKRYFTSGSYIKMVEDLYNKGFISKGKQKELLLDAYRSDLVFNTDSEVLIND